MAIETKVIKSRYLVVMFVAMIVSACGIEEWVAYVTDSNSNILEKRSAFSQDGCQKHLAVLRRKHPLHWTLAVRS